jgi:hypothetical protein
VIEELHRQGEMTVRIAYNLFTQRPKQELDDFSKWVTMTRPGEGSDFYRMNGAGEMLTFSAADFEDFLEPRPDRSPVKVYGGYHQARQQDARITQAHACAHGTHGLLHRFLGWIRRDRSEPLWGGLGCACFAFRAEGAKPSGVESVAPAPLSVARERSRAR